MQKLFRALFLFALVLLVRPALAQTAPAFKGAEATLPKYKALYYLNDSDPNKIKGTLRNINNALEDERIKGKVEIELVAFGAGYTVFEKTSGYEETLLALQKKGVILAQCSNTIRERKIDTATLFPFISYVPSGNGEIIIRQAQGWATIHP